MIDNTTQSIAKEYLIEKKRERRWRNIRTLGWILVILLYAFLIFSSSSLHTPSGDYVSLVRLTGTIMPDTTFSSEKTLPLLEQAFANKKAKGVILLIDSPGGSAVQASIIHDNIIYLKKLYHKKVIVVAEDALASGGYLVATAADKIFVNKNTLTGSIGVIFSGFGFVDALKKIGITRRVFTAGNNKDRLDPFANLNSQDTKKIHDLLIEVHNNFISNVIESRGNKLNNDKALLFSGDFWTGETATKLGLVDGTANLWEVIKNEFKVQYVKDYTPKPSVLSLLLSDVKTILPINLAHRTTLKEEAF